jgi:hypothetical protein
MIEEKNIEIFQRVFRAVNQIIHIEVKFFCQLQINPPSYAYFSQLQILYLRKMRCILLLKIMCSKFFFQI